MSNIKFVLAALLCAVLAAGCKSGAPVVSARSSQERSEAARVVDAHKSSDVRAADVVRDTLKYAEVRRGDTIFVTREVVRVRERARVVHDTLLLARTDTLKVTRVDSVFVERAKTGRKEAPIVVQILVAAISLGFLIMMLLAAREWLKK